MAQKAKKKNQILTRKESTFSPKKWPNLPHQLINIIARRPGFMTNITSFGGVTKSWRSTPVQCTPHSKSRLPQLVEISGKKHCADEVKDHNYSHTIDIKFNPGSFIWYSRRRGSNNYQDPWIFKGHSHGNIVAMRADSSLNCCLWEPAKRCGSFLPCWDSKHPFKFATLSSSPEFPNGACTVMALTGISSPAFAFFRWRKGEKEWIFEDCEVKDPHDSNYQNMVFVNAIGFKGKFYALSLQGTLVVVEDTGSTFRITTTKAGRAMPSGVSRHFREYFVELNNEVLLVFLISRKSINLVEDVEVFRLDLDNLSWVKVENLGDQTLFLEDECCMGVTASIVGCRKNCIYFTHGKVDVWLVYDMEIGRISPVSGDDGEAREYMKWDELIDEEAPPYPGYSIFSCFRYL